MASGSLADAQNSRRGAARTFRGRAEDEWLTLLASRPAERMVSRFNSTAIVFGLELGGGLMTAFKPERPGQESWWRHEIVSYRFATLLGIENRVPPTVGRRVPASVFGRYAASDRLVVGEGGLIRGSASVWMPVLRGGGLHTEASRRVWREWLSPGATIPAEHRERARQSYALALASRQLPRPALGQIRQADKPQSLHGALAPGGGRQPRLFRTARLLKSE